MTTPGRFAAGAPFSRLLHAPLLSKARMAILDAVAAAPGSSISDVARALGVHQSSVHSNVHILTRAGLLTRQKAGRRVLLFSTGALSHRERFLASFGSSRPVYEAIERGVVGAGALCHELGATHQSVRYHLHRLARIGALRVEERRVLRTQRVYVPNTREEASA